MSGQSCALCSRIILSGQHQNLLLRQSTKHSWTCFAAGTGLCIGENYFHRNSAHFLVDRTYHVTGLCSLHKKECRQNVKIQLTSSVLVTHCLYAQILYIWKWNRLSWFSMVHCLERRSQQQ